MTGPTQREQPWSVPVALEDVPETGRHVALVADERTRTAIAQLAQLSALPRLEATFDLTRRGRDGLHVVGQVSAAVGQTCVVTLDAIENEIEEPIDLIFGPEAPSLALEADNGVDVEVAAEDPPEPLVNGRVDLGVIATEFLMLAIDPYPRKPGATFEPPPAGDDAGHPFAALAALKKQPKGGNDG
jgi:Large ribosomal RNA subunit accumulation protein YceD